MSARFFVEADFDGRLTGEQAHHAARVLRLRRGETVAVCDGAGREADAVVAEVTTGEVLLEVGAWRDCVAEPTVLVTVYIGVAKGDRMDYAIQKAVELGAARLVPFVSKRCVAKGDGVKRLRWQKIAEQAASQSGRGTVPEVTAAVDFQTACREAAEADVGLFCYELPVGVPLKRALERATPRTVSVVCGPEGGFDADEAQLAASMLTCVTLGPRILRCETAPVAALTAVLYQYGQL